MAAPTAPQVVVIPNGSFGQNTVLVIDDATQRAVVVDPGEEHSRILSAVRHRQQFAAERIPILRRQPLRERGQIVALLRIQPPQDRQQAIAFGGRDVSEQRLQARPVGAQVRTQPPALPLHRVQHAELRA